MKMEIQLKLMNYQLKIKWNSNETQMNINWKYLKFDPVLDLRDQNKDLSKEDDRRITDHPTFQAHLLGLLGKTGKKMIWKSLSRWCP